MIVSNSTPLINFAAIDRLEILHQLFGEIIIPQAVHDELFEKGKRYPSASALNRSDFVKINSLQSTSIAETLMHELDAGEAEAIALAIETNASLILLDEVTGRSFADYYNIACLGSIGCLTLAKQKGHIPKIKPLLDDMQDKGRYWVHPNLYRRVLIDNNEID